MPTFEPAAGTEERMHDHQQRSVVDCGSNLCTPTKL